MILKRTGKHSIAKFFVLFKHAASGIQKRPHRRDKTRKPPVADLKEVFTICDGVLNGLICLTRQTDHEEDVEARAAQPQRLANDLFELLVVISGFPLLRLAYFEIMAFGADF